MGAPTDDFAQNDAAPTDLAEQPETDPTPPPVAPRPWLPAGESKLGIAGAVVGLVGGLVGGVLGAIGFGYSMASEQAAEDAKPSARIARVADGRVTDGSSRDYPVRVHTDLAFTFHRGESDLQPLIVVWSSSTTGSGRYFPVDPNALTPRTASGADGCDPPENSDDWYCGGVTIGASGDRGTQFVVSVYGVPTQITGIVRSKVAENDAGAASNGWANLPTGLTPLDSITVTRK